LGKSLFDIHLLNGISKFFSTHNEINISEKVSKIPLIGAKAFTYDLNVNAKI